MSATLYCATSWWKELSEVGVTAKGQEPSLVQYEPTRAACAIWENNLGEGQVWEKRWHSMDYTAWYKYIIHIIKVFSTAFALKLSG